MTEFTSLLEQEIPRLRRYARALTRDAERADDLVQNCLVRALEKQHLWVPGTDLRAWLFTLLHHVRVDGLRRLAREESRKETAMSLMLPALRPPDARLELLELDRALDELPENQRRVLLLVCREDMNYERAASMLAVPIGTVRSRIGRARASLREKLGRPAIRHCCPVAGIKAAAAPRPERRLASA